MNDEIRILRINQCNVSGQIKLLKLKQASIDQLIEAQLQSQARLEAEIVLLQQSALTQKFNQYRVDLLEIKLDNLSDAVIEGFQELKSELKVDIRELKGELKGDIRELKGELKGDIRELKGDIQEQGELIRELKDMLMKQLSDK
jgi:hypothetical protein